MQSYMDFLGETIAETYRTGKPTPPNKNNPLTKARSDFETRMENEAKQQGKDVSEIALEHVKKNAGQLSKYILSKGEIPNDSDPIQLATQAYNLRNHEVSNIANALGVDHDTASTYLDDAENRAMEMGSPEADSFIGEIFTALGRLGHNIAAKRKAKGKKGGIFGGIGDIFDPNGGAQTNTNTSLGEDIKNQLGALYSDIKQRETKSAINQYLPYAIIAVVVIILITVMISRRK